ncbi:type VII secretion target [Nocardia asteroides]
MSEYLDIEPQQLRVIATQHERVAMNIRKWGEIPHEWLTDFEYRYGVIAEPVRAALVDYYDRRHAKAERLAAAHERARENLLAAAESFEDTDREGKRRIAHAGGFGNEAARIGPVAPAPPGPARPVNVGPDTAVVNGSGPGRPFITAPGRPEDGTRTVQAPLLPAAWAPDTGLTGLAAATSATGTTPSVQAPLLPAAWAPDTGLTGPAAATSATGTTPFSIDVQEPAAASSLTTAGDTSKVPGTTGEQPAAAPLMPNPFVATVADSASGTSGRVPAPVAPGLFAAAAHAAEDRRALPSFVVGERVDEDLALARTLLAATLAAVADSASDLEWAVAVVRTTVGPIIVLTSTEGRGWLPAGLFLPSEVSLPWAWDFVLGTARHKAVTASEGSTDPARVLAEFDLPANYYGSVRISALASSAAISSELRAALGPYVAIEGQVSAAESAVDFTAPGVGLVDRLALTGSGELLSQAATVPDTEIPATCLRLARSADTLVRATVPVMMRSASRTAPIGVESSTHWIPIRPSLPTGGTNSAPPTVRRHRSHGEGTYLTFPTPEQTCTCPV